MKDVNEEIIKDFVLQMLSIAFNIHIFFPYLNKKINKK